MIILSFYVIGMIHLLQKTYFKQVNVDFDDCLPFVNKKCVQWSIQLNLLFVISGYSHQTANKTC